MSQTWSTNSAVQYLTQEYESTAANAAFAYNAGSLGTFSLIGSYTRTDYPNRFFLLPTGLTNDGYSMYSGGDGIWHQWYWTDSRCIHRVVNSDFVHDWAQVRVPKHNAGAVTTPDGTVMAHVKI